MAVIGPVGVSSIARISVRIWKNREMSKKLAVAIVALLLVVIMGCARGATPATQSRPVGTLPVVTLGPTATFVPTRSERPTSTSIPTATPTPIVYIVQKGDILGQIALDHNVSVDALMAANGLTSAHVLSIGQRLIIPNEAMLSKLALGGVDVAITAPTPAYPTPTLGSGSLSWSDAEEHIGRKAQVEGLIVRTRKTGGSVYLFFSDPPEEGHLRIKIPAARMAAFDRPEVQYLDHWVMATGVVARTEEGLLITIQDALSLVTLD